MTMRKFRCVIVLLLLSLASSALAAPQCADLLEGVLTDEIVFTLGVRDSQLILDELSSNSLLGRLARAGAVRANIPDIQLTAATAGISAVVKGDAAASFGGQAGSNSNSSTTMATAFQLNVDVPSELILTMSSELGTLPPEFEVQEPLSAVCEIETEEFGKIYVAKLARDEETYLLAANDVKLLRRIAENTAVAEAHSTDNVYVRGSVSADVFKKEGIPVDRAFLFEIGIASDDAKAKLDLWSNALDMWNDTGLTRFRDCLSDEPAPEPAVFGTGTLMGMFNFRLPLREDVKPEDLFSGSLLETVNDGLEELFRVTGVTWDDVTATLRGNTTLGIGGNLSFFGVQYPGAWLHISGLPEDKASMLTTMVLMTSGRKIGAKQYSQGDWHGFRVSFPISMMMLSGPDGLLLAALDVDELDTDTRLIPASLEHVTEPRSLALGLSGKELQPALKRMYENFGALLMSLTGMKSEELQRTQEQVTTALNNIALIDAVELYSNSLDAFTLELTPQPELVNMYLPSRD